MVTQGRLKNVLLRRLPASSFDDLAPLLEPVALPQRFKLSEPGKACTSVYFPETGVASVIGQVGAEWQEIGLFGREGASCSSSLLGSATSPYLIIMQVAGRGHRVPADRLIAMFHADFALREVFLHYIQSFIIQMSQSCIANCQYNTVQRMARWFLMIHDRVEGDSINLTHEFIAMMLGVGRTGVTLALHTLEKGGLISTARKRVTILDRPALEKMTASVYGFAEAEYRKLIGPPSLPEAPGLDVPDWSAIALTGTVRAAIARSDEVERVLD